MSHTADGWRLGRRWANLEMKVAINLLGLPSVRQGGAGFYSETLIRALASHPDASLRVLCHPAIAEELLDLAEEIEILAYPEDGRARLRKAVRLARSIRNPLRYGYTGGRQDPFHGCDLVHYPLSFMSGPVHELPNVVTCVDLQHLVFPSFFSVPDRILRRIRWHRALRMADGIVAISHDTKRALVDRLGVPASKIQVVHLACNPRFFEEVQGGDPGFGRFVFYPASPLPAKNHDLLLRGFARAASRDPGLRLVLCGPALHDWAPVRRAAAAAGVSDRVELLGHVRLARLKALYAHAQGMIFPSRFEGFGLPVVEAMASGCPVAASNLPSIVEIADGWCHLFDPTSEETVATAIAWASSLQAEERGATAAAGRRRALRFHPREMASRTLEVYEAVASAPRPGT
jgi:glycosyltransferase involved in cell wall biosynthesis